MPLNQLYRNNVIGNAFSITLLTVFAMGCNNPFGQPPSITEGNVIYKITYSGDNPYRSQGVLPEETSLFFKDKKACFITTGMGIVLVIDLLDNEKKKYSTLFINSLGENYAFTEAPEDVRQQENNPEYKIEKTDEKKIIAGLECYKAIVSDITNNRRFDIYYYEKANVTLGNSPYKDFNFLVMEYRDTRFGISMMLQATKVDFSPVDENLLTVHGQYSWVDKNTFLSIIKILKLPV